MDYKTSARIVQDYATQHNLTVLNALTQLDHLTSIDWFNTSPGAPKGYIRKTSLDQDKAVTVFCKNRKAWIKEALALGLNLQGFTFTAL
jgi:hypothetical protein